MVELSMTGISACHMLVATNDVREAWSSIIKLFKNNFHPVPKERSGCSFRRLGSLGVSGALMRPLVAHYRRCAIVLGALTYTDRVCHTGLTQH